MMTTTNKKVIRIIAAIICLAAIFVLNVNTADAATKKAAKKSVTVRAAFTTDDKSELPETVKVRLYKNGKATKKVATLSEDNGYKATFKKLNKSSKWTVKAVTKVDGYHVSVKGKNSVRVHFSKIYTGEFEVDGINID